MTESKSTIIVDQYRDAATAKAGANSYAGLRIHALPGLHDFLARLITQHVARGSHLLESALVTGLVNNHRVPALYHSPRYMQADGLMSYGPSVEEQYRRAAAFVDKILKGAKPGEIPVEQPTKFDLIINLKRTGRYAATTWRASARPAA